MNRVYLPHPLAKWQCQLIAGLELQPVGLADRLKELWGISSLQALDRAEALLIETVQLADTNTGADIGSFREALFQRRRVVDPPHAVPEDQRSDAG